MVPFFDTNIHRVLHRAFFGPEAPTTAVKPKEMFALAADLVPPGEGWAWNQAVMEFGALHCTPRKPRCEECPIAQNCRAHPLTPEYLARAPRKEAGEMATMLRRNDTDDGLSRLWYAVESLEGDGLIRTAPARDSGAIAPGPAEAVTEEPSAYYAAPGAYPGDNGLRMLRVALP